MKACRAGESAGYGRRFIVTHDTTLAVLPIGYGDGWRRALTNNADVLIGGRRHPLVGTVSMDNITVDVGAAPPPVGATATLIGRDGSERITCEEVARRLDTINYEVTCGLSARVPREYHDDGEPLLRAGGTRRGRDRQRPRGHVSRTDAAATGPRAVVATTLAGTDAWVVGGAPRDRLLGRHTDDIDIVLAGDVAGRRARARAAAPAARPFALSDEFGAWRVVAHDHSWQVDLNPLRGGSLEDDLSLRDFTINAIAEPLAGGELVDPLGGAADLAARRLRAASPRAFADDPLRVLRLARFAVELDLESDSATIDAARAGGPGARRRGRRAGVRRAAPSARRRRGARRPRAARRARGDRESILPELCALRGVEQNRFHHRDVFGHTIEVLGAVVELQRDPAAVLGAEHAEAVAALLREPLLG